MPPGEFNHLGDLCFRNFERKNATNANTMAVDMQHDINRFFAVLAEYLFQDVNHELHRRVVVVQQKHLVEAGLLGLGARFGDDSGAGVPRPVLIVIVVARIFHRRILCCWSHPKPD